MMKDSQVTVIQEADQRQQKAQDERRALNTADLPDLQPLPPKDPTDAALEALWEARRTEPLRIHGRSVEEYRAMYRRLVEPRLLYPSGRPRPHSLDLGRRIKQRLWVAVSCPKFTEQVGDKNKIDIMETSGNPGLKGYAPLIEVDVWDEPPAKEPPKKRARH
ncbi:uncharacterized protein C22orf31-like isoform X1 [Brienomyrus brachyistius]|uniref:uncharacterized protein C22orf31-like isoform X1 n=1 Tax=Brienomyrus brachyistius TaxID=42636 RepID=UPI0020B43103|nr:uncharacterized protein C22orf31-like isoform X1 [Brienomyrus brachyistius]